MLERVLLRSPVHDVSLLARQKLRADVEKYDEVAGAFGSSRELHTEQIRGLYFILCYYIFLRKQVVCS